MREAWACGGAVESAGAAVSFASDIAKWAKKTGIATDRVPAFVCMELSAKIIGATPVDTGRAKGNWQATIASPASGTLETNDPSGAAVIAKASIVAQAAAGGVFYLVNNLPYIRRLEYGYSSQAPAGMVRVTVQEFEQAVAAAVQKVKA